VPPLGRQSAPPQPRTQAVAAPTAPAPPPQPQAPQRSRIHMPVPSPKGSPSLPCRGGEAGGPGSGGGAAPASALAAAAIAATVGSIGAPVGSPQLHPPVAQPQLRVAPPNLTAQVLAHTSCRAPSPPPSTAVLGPGGEPIRSQRKETHAAPLGRQPAAPPPRAQAAPAPSPPAPPQASQRSRSYVQSPESSPRLPSRRGNASPVAGGPGRGGGDGPASNLTATTIAITEELRKRAEAAEQAVEDERRRHDFAKAQVLDTEARMLQVEERLEAQKASEAKTEARMQQAEERIVREREALKVREADAKAQCEEADRNEQHLIGIEGRLAARETRFRAEQRTSFEELQLEKARLIEREGALDTREAALEAKEEQLSQREQQHLEACKEYQNLMKGKAALDAREAALEAKEEHLSQREQQHLEACREYQKMKVQRQSHTRRVSPRSNASGKENYELKRQLEEQQDRMHEIKKGGWRQEVPSPPEAT